MFSLLWIGVSSLYLSYAAKPDLEAKVAKQAETIRKLQIENSILKGQTKKTSPQSTENSKLAKVDNALQISEKALFEKFDQSFRQGKAEDYKKALRLMVKNYPRSPYLAEIYLLTARSAIAKKKYKTALKALDRVISKHPKSPAYPKALYAKANTFQELGLDNQAKAIYQDLAKRFANQPEGFKSALLLKNKNKK